MQIFTDVRVFLCYHYSSLYLFIISYGCLYGAVAAVIVVVLNIYLNYKKNCIWKKVLFILMRYVLFFFNFPVFIVRHSVDCFLFNKFLISSHNLHAQFYTNNFPTLITYTLSPFTSSQHSRTSNKIAFLHLNWWKRIESNKNGIFLLNWHNICKIFSDFE